MPGSGLTEGGLPERRDGASTVDAARVVQWLRVNPTRIMQHSVSTALRILILQQLAQLFEVGDAGPICDPRVDDVLGPAEHTGFEQSGFGKLAA